MVIAGGQDKDLVVVEQSTREQHVNGFTDAEKGVVLSLKFHETQDRVSNVRNFLDLVASCRANDPVQDHGHMHAESEQKFLCFIR